jgi:acyl dehydratase
MIEPGTVLGPTAWRRVEQADIDTFARLSGDHQWIHTDVERAVAESPYGTTIAHGNLTLAMIDGFRDELVPVTWRSSRSSRAASGRRSSSASRSS